MELRYSAAVNSLSAALIMVFSPFVCRFRGQNAIFSASLGIIIYTIVKSIVVECGWGFAVTVGVSVGLLIESSVILFGIILFTEFDSYSGRRSVCCRKRGRACSAFLCRLCNRKGNRGNERNNSCGIQRRLCGWLFCYGNVFSDVCKFIGIYYGAFAYCAWMQCAFS